MATKRSLKELLKGINEERLRQPCTDYHLAKVARHITQWQSIAPHLRLEEVDEEEIVTKYPNNVRDQRLAMLRRWRKKTGDKATYKELAKVFWELEKVDLVDEVCKVLSSECSSSESEGESEQGWVEGPGSQRWTAPRYAGYLKSVYCTIRPPVQSHQLLPPPMHTVFNLALIQKQRLEVGNEELVRLLQRGQVKEAAETHTEIELSNLMRADDEVRKVILIEGAPGSGKSTLAWHICQQWGKGELFPEYEVVVFVQLRDLELQSATCVADILPGKCTDQAADIAALLTGSGRWGRGVLFVLDGWDELQPGCPLHHLLMQLIKGPTCLNMHCSSVVVTSRPVSSAGLRNHASSRVEVLGFKPEEVQEYFKACFGRNHQLYTRFVDQLKERPVIEASCFLPLNAVIVVHIFQACRGRLPHTLHGVFEELVLSCIKRHVTDRNSSVGDITTSHFRNLPLNIENPLLDLCKLAFYGIKSNKVVFSETDLKACKISVDLSTTLSLVQEVEPFALRKEKSYNFFHLQIQELLAAYHISKLKEDEQVRIFRKQFGQPRFAAVFQFYAAFTKLQAQGIKEVLEDMAKERQYYMYKTILQCIYEAQTPSLCQLPWHASNEKYPQTFILLSVSDPPYTIALGYVLCHYCYHCSEELSVVVYSFDNITLLVKEFLQQQSHVTDASPQCNAYGSLKLILRPPTGMHLETFIQLASELLTSLQPFITGLVLDTGECYHNFSRTLDISSTFEVPGCTFVQFICSTKHLHHFTIDSVNFQITSSALKAACTAMATNISIKYLALRDCKFDITDPAGPLLHAIPLSSTLKVIDLTGTSLGGCVSPLLMGLASNTSVVELIFKNCKVDLTGENGQALCSMLKTNTTLRTLNLSGEHDLERVKKGITHLVDLHAVCVGLTLNTSLAYLDLSGCHLSVTGESGPALAHMLQTNSTLKSLKLDGYKGISNEEAVYLAQGLAQNRGLETLSLVGRRISTAVVELGEALKTNKCLLSLDISLNHVGERFGHIVRSPQVNSTLRDLRARQCGILTHDVLDIPQSSLESLDLSGNPIGDEGAAHIAQLVTNSRSLYQLNLGKCDIGGRGVECLASALEGNTSLEILHIPGNKFTDTGLLALGRSLKRNKSLKTLDMPYNNTTEEGEKQFVLSLCENEYLTYLRVAHSEKVRDEVNRVNQIRQDKNHKTLSMFT